MVPHNRSIDVSTKEEIVDCIESEVYGRWPLELVSLFEQFPHETHYDFLRAFCVPYLFHEADKIYVGAADPIRQFREILRKLTKHVSSLAANRSLSHLFEVAHENEMANVCETDIAVTTGIHYGNLFRDFSFSQFLEAKELLETRLCRNEIELPKIGEATMLDQGCGGGRYTIAWKLLGVKRAIGLDISEIGIEDANAKLRHFGLEGVEFQVGSVLSLPFDEDSFDIVYSNGVLHHTIDWQLGIREQVRTLRPGGFGWQYLIENPGGIFWDKIEILRAILKGVSGSFAQKVLALLGVPANRIFYMLDHVMTPINTRVSEIELYECLRNAGARHIRRLDRGTDFDRIEMIHKKVPFAYEKFGVGENRYVFSK